MTTALLAGRLAVALAILLAIGTNLWLVQREDVLDAATNAALFAVIAWVIAEVCRRLIDALEQARALTRDLAVREMLLDTIVASTPIVTLDREGRTRRVTPAAANLLRVDRLAAIAQPFGSLLPGFDETALTKARQGGEVLAPSSGPWTSGPSPLPGPPLTLHANVLPDDISPEHIILTLGDDSEAETIRRSERDLIARLSKVWRLNSMGEMAATLAHELNQPLSAAAVYLHASQVELAGLGPAADGPTKTIELAKAQLLRAGDIIRRMREHVATGARSVTEERASLIVLDLAPVFALIGQDTDTPVDLDMEETDDRVLVDRIQIQQALANLVRNAVDAVIGREGGRVTLTGRSHGSDGYEIAVSDNGDGIPAEQMDEIFHPMTTAKPGGMGLGLSVTRSIVESHGAALVVSRNPQGGATFSFCLPRLTEPDLP
ncbi:sensor histidine kinase [Brevundimonas vesicularis]|uniref:sensor histidine kinase n=1 Tax=Brevundimonas vesicularis TaxID=41276 RepID=UPI0022AC111D|nr:ATP-binding protein [Brevundimonas vesicularis]